MNSVNKTRQLLAGLSVFALGPSAAQAEYALNLVKGVTESSHAVYGLHMYMLWVVTAIGLVVFGVMFYSIFHHRKSKGAVASQFHEHTTVEVVWTIIPFLILLSIAIPATSTLIDVEDSSNADMTVKVTGYQWKWRYEYLDDDVDFFSSLDAKSNRARQLNSDLEPKSVANYLLDVDNPLVVPINKKIRFLFTAADVIHSWWVPDLGWKKDAIPGFVTDAWTKLEEPGIYRGQCAELCGRDHGFMPIVVKAVTEEDYAAWVEDWKKQHAEAAAPVGEELTLQVLMAKGEEVYNTHCASCHQANGEGIPGTFPPIAGSPLAKGPVEDHIDIVLNGKGMMPAFGEGDMLNDVDLAAVITYQRNAFGNETGDVVQPSDIEDNR